MHAQNSGKALVADGLRPTSELPKHVNRQRIESTKHQEARKNRSEDNSARGFHDAEQ
jgi:hypothetical protein